MLSPVYAGTNLTPQSLTETERISRATKRFNVQRGAFWSEGGGKFECSVSTYLLCVCVFFLGVQLILNRGSSSSSKY